jgi:hypothetical protein
MDEEVFGVLRQHGVANTAVSSEKMPMCLEVTANFVCVRFHGLEGGAAHDYNDRELLRRRLPEGVRELSSGFQPGRQGGTPYLQRTRLFDYPFSPSTFRLSAVMLIGNFSLDKFRQQRQRFLPAEVASLRWYG